MSTTVVEEVVPAPSPLDACMRFLDLPHVVLLESAAYSDRLGRYSFLAADPFLILRSKGSSVQRVRRGREVERTVGDPFDTLRSLLNRYATEPIDGLPPFQGGAAGYLGYDLLHHLERVPPPRWDDLALPDLSIGLYDWVVAWDHADGRCWVVSTGLGIEEGPDVTQEAAARATAVVRRLREPAAAPPVAPQREVAPGPPRYPVPGLPGVCSTFSRAGYLSLVDRVREYILAGDIFQANLSQRLETPWPAPPIELYRRLRHKNPAAFAAYLDGGDAVVVSASPERFLRLQGDAVETRPIKGTVPRGFTPMHDLALEHALRRSGKDHAENVMIVDLLRNDLSRVCRDHSVQVPELTIIERFPRVHHLVSTVVGRLRPGMDAVDLLRATFPGGSITGAPKVRAMEIIHELEPTRRSVYTGAIGYIGFNGEMDTSIAIRTFIVKSATAYFQVGGGLVADSDPEREYMETLAKAEGLVAALEDGRGAVH